jgi:hypothetical protein
VYPEEFSPVSTRLYESSIASIPADIPEREAVAEDQVDLVL